MTRDRLYGVCEWLGHEFTVVDTAGLEMDATPIADRDFSQADIEAQTRVAIEEANAIVFLLDVRQGLTAIDRDIAQLLRRSGRPVIVAANKADTFGQDHFRHEILGLGFPEVLMVSAEHGIGVDDLLDRVLDNLPPSEAEVGEEEAARIAIMGRDFGAYFAIEGIVRQPDLYRCAITIDGFFDWGSFLGEMKYFQYQSNTYGYYRRKLGDPKVEKEKFRLISPLNFISRAHAAVFVAHDKSDNDIYRAQSNRLVSELEQNKLVHETYFAPEVTLPKDQLANQVELASRIEAFLEKNLKNAR